MSEGALARLSSSEWRLLYALDDLTYGDSEDGGDGWVGIRAVAEELAVTYNWASQLLRNARGRGFAERRGRRGRAVYALSEAGAALLHPDTATSTSSSVATSPSTKGEQS